LTYSGPIAKAAFRGAVSSMYFFHSGVLDHLLEEA